MEFEPEIPESLAQSLRATAARAAELAGGGCTLLFAAAPGSGGPEASAELRAASGFPNADAARAGAAEVASPVGECLRSGKAVVGQCSALGPNAAGGLLVLALAWEGRVRGALLVGSPAPIESPLAQQLAHVAATTALQLDHMQLSAEVDAIRGKRKESVEGDELLKLSEQLFEQDIELLRRDEKLGKIEKLKNDFIEKMSRELRTPLNNIIESVIGVIAGENDSLSESAIASLRNALDEGTAFQRTLQNILDLWRIKQNELPVEAQEVNFAEVVDEAIFSVQETLGEKPVTIEKDFREALPKLKTDLAKVNQVLFLLLDNAAKFTEKGTITITPRIEDDHLVCEVADTGIGICPDDQQLVFDEFFQVDDTASTRYRGAGLGLALVRDLLVLLDGEIQVLSEAGKGTWITFRIPVQIL